MSQTIIITNHDDISINYLIEKLDTASISNIRINSEDINKYEFNIEPEGNFDCTFDKKQIDLKASKNVLFRRIPLKFNEAGEGENHKYLNLERKHFLEGLYLSLRECKWINPMFATQIAERKIHQLQIAKSIGLQIPKSIITNKRSTAFEFLKYNKYSIIKPISNGLQITKNQVFSIYTNEINFDSFSKLDISEAFDTPIFLQEKIKNTGDIRVTIIGNSVFAVKITKESSEVDWRKPGIEKKYELINLPPNLIQKLLSLNNYFQLIYSAIDLILKPDGDFVFLEVNPVGEWVWLEMELGIKISSEIINQLR